MTGEVAALVLRDNYQQALALSIAEDHARESIDAHARMIRALEREGRLDRALEALPTDEELLARKARGGRARAARARGAARLRQDRPQDRSARERRARRSLLRGRPRELLPAGVARALPRRDPRPPAAPPDRRHLDRQQPGQPHRARASPTASRRTPARPPPRSCAPTSPAARCTACARTGRRSRSSTARCRPAVQAGLFYEAEKVLERSARWFIRRPGRTRDMAALIERAVARSRVGARVHRRPAGAARSRPRRRGGADARSRAACRRRWRSAPLGSSSCSRRSTSSTWRTSAGSISAARGGHLPGGGRRARTALAARRDREDPDRRALAPARRDQRVRRDLSDPAGHHRFGACRHRREMSEDAADAARDASPPGWRRAPTRWRDCDRS